MHDLEDFIERDNDDFGSFQSDRTVLTGVLGSAELTNDVACFSDIIDKLVAVFGDCSDLDEAGSNEKKSSVIFAHIVQGLSLSKVTTERSRNTTSQSFPRKTVDSTEERSAWRVCGRLTEDISSSSSKLGRVLPAPRNLLAHSFPRRLIRNVLTLFGLFPVLHEPSQTLVCQREKTRWFADLVQPSRLRILEETFERCVSNSCGDDDFVCVQRTRNGEHSLNCPPGLGSPGFVSVTSRACPGLEMNPFGLFQVKGKCVFRDLLAVP